MKWSDFLEDVRFELTRGWESVEDFFLNVYYFFKNIYLFRKDLWNFRPWDHEYCRDIYCTALETLKEEIYRNGHEIDESRLKKVSDMEELLRLLNTDVFDVLYGQGLFENSLKGIDEFNGLCEKGEKARFKRICELLRESGSWWD